VKKAEKSASRAKSEKGSAKSSKAAAPAARSGKTGKTGKPEVKADAKADAKGEAKAAAKAGKKPNAAPKGRAKPAAKPARGKASVRPAEAKPNSDASDAALEVQPMLPLAGDPIEPSAAGDDAAPATAMSEEEQELSKLYEADLDAPSMAHGEFKDQKTADEDRPMLPEINARDERRRGWEDRRERRRLEREQRRLARRDRHRGAPADRASGAPDRPGARGGDQDGVAGGAGARSPRGIDRGAPTPHRGPQGSSAPGGPPRHASAERSGERPADRAAERPAAPLTATTAGNGAATAVATGATTEPLAFGTPMGAATAALFVQLRNGQPLPVRQLAAMLRKRSMIEGDPEQMWPQLRAELLSDERAFRAAGLRPRVVHRGRDLFAAGVACMSPVAELEAQLAGNVAGLQTAAERSLLAWMTAASPAAFERLIYAYLVAEGYRDVQWVKRVDGIAYAQATAPGIARSVLVSARSGASLIDRRGIGELRVGVEAKGLPFGYLFAAAGLSPDAERELERAGRSIAVVCGEALVAALVHAGIGVASTAVTVRFIDEQFLDDLNVG
jgi:Restriction endonuclease